jgi:hypothetical protein
MASQIASQQYLKIAIQAAAPSHHSNFTCLHKLYSAVQCVIAVTDRRHVLLPIRAEVIFSGRVSAVAHPA